jgi:hypothetical protein
MKDRFVLISRWRLDCDIEQAWQRILAISEWPEWWPQARRVVVDEAMSCNTSDDSTRPGRTAIVEWKTPLGYPLCLQVTTTRAVPPFELEGKADGDLQGHGLWLLEPQGSHRVLVTYRWDVHLNCRWMRVSAPLLRPVFAWNHFTVMRAGAAGMARAIGCRMTGYEDFSFAPRVIAPDVRNLQSRDALL